MHIQVYYDEKRIQILVPYYLLFFFSTGLFYIIVFSLIRFLFPRSVLSRRNGLTRRAQRLNSPMCIRVWLGSYCLDMAELTMLVRHSGTRVVFVCFFSLESKFIQKFINIEKNIDKYNFGFLVITMFGLKI